MSLQKMYRYKMYRISWASSDKDWSAFVSYAYEHFHNVWGFGVGVFIFSATPQEMTAARKEFPHIGPDSFVLAAGPSYDALTEDLDPSKKGSSGW